MESNQRCAVFAKDERVEMESDGMTVVVTRPRRPEEAGETEMVTDWYVDGVLAREGSPVTTVYSGAEG